MGNEVLYLQIYFDIFSVHVTAWIAIVTTTLNYIYK